MRGIRHLIRDRRVLAMIIVALALCMKMLVPPGYMFGTSSGATSGARHLTVQLCFDGITHRTLDITIPADGQSSGDKDAPHHPDVHCPYTSLGISTLGGVDLPLLALLATFLLILGFVPVQPVPRGESRYLRPPLRGPPAFH